MTGSQTFWMVAQRRRLAAATAFSRIHEATFFPSASAAASTRASSASVNRMPRTFASGSVARGRPRGRLSSMALVYVSQKRLAIAGLMSNNKYMSKHTSSKTITAGTRIILVSNGQTLGGGEVIAIDGKDVLIAQEIDYTIGSDGGVDTLVRSELSVDRYTISRSIVAWAA